MKAGTPDPLLTRWAALEQALGRAPDPKMGQKLLRAWSGRLRYYHNLDHLRACLALFDTAREEAEHPEELELALWFHDALYNTLSHKNEARCAAWARRYLGADPRGERVAQLILATQHKTPPKPGDEALIVDIDLGILGQVPDIYAEFEKNVRREYFWVPEAAWRSGRAAVLQGFLDRQPIYQTPRLRAQLETQARANLSGALSMLLHSS